MQTQTVNIENPARTAPKDRPSFYNLQSVDGSEMVP